MPVTISGSTGISGVDGSAGTPALIGSDADTGIFLAAGQVSASVNGTAGNVPLVSGTAQASTSGTSIDFTGIPSWAKRITVMLRGVSTSGTSSIILRVGTSTGFNTTGYDSTASASTTASGYQSSTAGFILVYASPAANSVFKGIATIATMGSDIWVQSANISDSVSQLVCSASSGSIAVGGTLDRIRITTVNGTDTFDAGSINIMYE